MGTRTWAPGSPEYLYHVYDDTVVTAAFAKGHKLDIAGLGGGVEDKWVYSLVKDMDALRTYGAGLGIVDSTRTLGPAPPPDGNDLMLLKVGTGTSHPVLFVGCHHAREWISVEIPYLVAEYLIRKYTPTPTTPQEKRIKHLLMNRQIWFVPMVNPNGHVYSVMGKRKWRPNRMSYTVPSLPDLPSTVAPAPAFMAPQYGGGSPKPIRYKDGVYTGVDINRNYPTTHWGEETSGTSRNPMDAGQRPGLSTLGSMTWCGPSKGSEPETKLIMGLGNFRAVISYHNNWEVIFYPDDAVGNVFVEWVGNGMVDLIAHATGVSPNHTYRFWNNSSTADPDNYLTTGELIDYAYETGRVASRPADARFKNRPAFTPELRPRDLSSPFGFSALPEPEIEPCFLENLPAALAFINCAGHDARADSHSATVTSAMPATKCQVVRNCWEVFKGWAP